MSSSLHRPSYANVGVMTNGLSNDLRLTLESLLSLEGIPYLRSTITSSPELAAFIIAGNLEKESPTGLLDYLSEGGSAILLSPLAKDGGEPIDNMFEVSELPNKARAERWMRVVLNDRQLLRIPVFDDQVISSTRKGMEPLGLLYEEGQQVGCGVALRKVGQGLALRISPDLLRVAASLLSGSQTSEDLGNDLIRVPVLNIYANLLHEALLHVCRLLHLPYVQKWYWPRDSEFAVCLTHDVEVSSRRSLRVSANKLIRAYSGIRNRDFGGAIHSFLQSARALARGFRLFILDENPYWNLERCLEVEQRIRGVSTFFFLNRGSWLDSNYTFSDSQVREAIDKLLRMNFEIGLHASYLSFNDQGMIAREKRLLEKVVQKPILGVRQHYARVKVPETWLNQQSVGFKYDCSYMFNDQIGFKAGICSPFQPLHTAKAEILNLVELPTSIVDGVFILHDRGTGDLSVAMQEVFDQVKNHHGLLCVLWHLHTFDQGDYPGLAEEYERVLELVADHSIWCARASEISDWWLRRRDLSIRTQITQKTLRVDLESQYEMEGCSIRVYQPSGTTLKLVETYPYAELTQTIGAGFLHLYFNKPIGRQMILFELRRERES